MDLARKLPGAEKVIRAVDERIFDGLFRTGMDLEDLDEPLTRQAEKELLDRVAQENGITDRELGELAKQVKNDETFETMFMRRLQSSQNGDISGVSTDRRTWKQSEEAAEKLFPEYKPQVSFLNKDFADHYGQAGSVRLDLYRDLSSIEIKNYDLSSSKNRNNMVRIIEKQFYQRGIHCPDGTEQAVLIDIMGQTASEETLTQIKNEIHRRTDGNMIVGFMRE